MYMKHQMGLQNKWFDYILNGTKRYELRLFDEKRRQIELGDTIEFTSKDGRKMECDVISLTIASNFHQLLRLLPYVHEFACYSMTRRYMEIILEQFYSEEQQQKYGVVAIGLSDPRPIDLDSSEA